MIYTKMTKRAIKIMFECHNNQVDKAGIPYVFHPWHIAEEQTDEVRTTVALLHDVVEDTLITLDDLKDKFPKDVIDALSLLTHKKDLNYYDYIKQIGTNSIAIDVKLADLRHNSDISRLNSLSEKDIKRLNKYRRCIEYLEERKLILDNFNFFFDYELKHLPNNLPKTKRL
jgi:(p)ppGpp synthase/HD superfamily hydrolase